MRLEALEGRVGGGRGSASAGGGGVDAAGRGVEERSRCGGGGGWVEWLESMLLDVQSAQLYQQVSSTRRVSSDASHVWGGWWREAVLQPAGCAGCAGVLLLVVLQVSAVKLVMQVMPGVDGERGCAGVLASWVGRQVSCVAGISTTVDTRNTTTL